MDEIVIFGAGALGSNICLNLCCDLRGSKDAKFLVIDFDKIEARNIIPGTQYYFDDQISLRKVDALRVNIYRACKFKIDVSGDKIDRSSNIPTKARLWIDCFDNTESRALLKEVAFRNKIDCVHVGFSPQFTAEIIWNEEYEVPGAVDKSFDICEAVGARSFVQYVSGFASIVISNYIENKGKESFLIQRSKIIRI